MYRGSKETPDYAYFVSLAQELKGINFAYTDSAEYIIGRAEMPKNRLVVHTGTEAKDAAFFSGKTYLQMRDFIVSEALKGVNKETPYINDLIRDNHFPGLRILCHEAESCLPYVKMLNDSNHHAHKLIKMYKVLSVREHHRGNSTEETVHPPHISLLDSRRGYLHEHVYKGELTPEGIENFIENYFHKRHHAHHYSEHPEEHVHKVIKCITGHNYNREVLKTTKGIVMLIHSGSEQEQSLVESFESVAEWLHTKKIGKYVKFRMLNQKKNLTPIPFFERPVLLMIRPHTQHDLKNLDVHIIRGNIITRKGLYNLMKNHGRYHLGEICDHADLVGPGEPETLPPVEPDTDL